MALISMSTYVSWLLLFTLPIANCSVFVFVFASIAATFRVMPLLPFSVHCCCHICSHRRATVVSGALSAPQHRSWGWAVVCGSACVCVFVVWAVEEVCWVCRLHVLRTTGAPRQWALGHSEIHVTCCVNSAAACFFTTTTPLALPTQALH